MRCQTEIVGRARKEGQSVSGNVVTGAAFGVTTIIRIARRDSCVRLVGYSEVTCAASNMSSGGKSFFLSAFSRCDSVKSCPRLLNALSAS